MKSWLLASSLILPIWLGTGGGAVAANYALVIGVDDYETQTDLAGAVNDATLIAGALQGFGVTELRVFLDHEVRYETLRSTWLDYVNRAEPGDTIILTYSGHGARVPDENGDEASPSQPDDRTDETLVLPGFNTGSAAGMREQIIDDELHRWFLEAAAKDIQVVFVADSCFSGTVTRGGRVRFLEGLMGVAQDRRRKPVAMVAETEEETIDNVVFFAGSREAEPVLEVMIDGRYHGALSYSFARALSMDGDLDGDGALGRDDLKRFIPRTAQSLNGSRHLPEINPSSGPDFPVLIPDATAAPDIGIAWPGNDLPDDETAPFDPNRLMLQSAPGAYWDRQTGNIIDATGEIIGYDVSEDRLAEVNDKFAVLDLVREGLMRNGVNVSIFVDGAPWHRELVEGYDVRIDIGPLTKRFMTVFNLANNGEVQLIFPVSNEEREAMPTGSVYSIETVATAPFGTDELVVVLTDEEPVQLRQALKWAYPAGDFVPILESLLARGGVAFGHFSLYTKEK